MTKPKFVGLKHLNQSKKGTYGKLSAIEGQPLSYNLMWKATEGKPNVVFHSKSIDGDVIIHNGLVVAKKLESNHVPGFSSHKIKLLSESELMKVKKEFEGTHNISGLLSKIKILRDCKEIINGDYKQDYELIAAKRIKEAIIKQFKQDVK